MALQDDFRECLITLDVKRALKIWAQANPHLPLPEDEDMALLTMHAARVQMQRLPERVKAYSRDWLRERAKLLPQKVFAVGISVSAPEYRKQQALAMRAAMAQAVLDAVKDGVRIEHEPQEITRRMNRARDRA